VSHVGGENKARHVRLLIVPRKKQPNPTKAMVHSVPRSAEKIRLPTIAAIFPMAARTWVLVALQTKRIHFRRVYLPRRGVSSLFALADKVNARMHSIKLLGFAACN